MGTQPCLFVCVCVVYGCFQCIMVELSSCDKDLVPHKTENISCFGPVLKILLTPWFRVLFG